LTLFRYWIQTKKKNTFLRVYEIHTHACGFLNISLLGHAIFSEHTLECIFKLWVWFWHVIFTRTSVITTLTIVILTSTNVPYRRRVRFLHVKCDFKTYKRDLDTHECNFYTFEFDFDTYQCNYGNHECDFELLYKKIA
jgi:hypothetical protein